MLTSCAPSAGPKHGCARPREFCMAPVVIIRNQWIFHSSLLHPQDYFIFIFLHTCSLTVNKTLICKLCGVSLYFFFHVAVIWKILYSCEVAFLFKCAGMRLSGLWQVPYIFSSICRVLFRPELFDHTPMLFAPNALRPRCILQSSPWATCAWLWEAVFPWVANS